MEVSRGKLHIVGEEVHIVLPHEYTWYGSNGGTAQIMEDIFTELASEISSNWPLYDKWAKVDGEFEYGTGDGYVDMIYLVARSNPNGYFTSNGVMNSCTHSEHIVYSSGSQTIKIKPAFDITGAGFQICGTQPLDAQYLVSFAGHEHGHYFFGYGNHFEFHQQYAKVNNYHGMEEYLSPYELLRLDYHTPQVADFTDVTMPIGDFASFTSNSGSELIKVPIGSSNRNEFFIIANRQNESTYDKLLWGDTAHGDPYRTLSSAAQDYDKGIYIYHAYPGEISSTGYPWGSLIDIECADGLWDWVQDGSRNPDWDCEQNIAYYKRNTPVYDINDNGGVYNYNHSLYNHDGLSLGYNELGNWFDIGDAAVCETNGIGTDRLFTNLEEVWTSSGVLGDRWDAWRVGYNEVFSPYSTPSTVAWDNSSTDIFIYLSSMNGNTANMEIYKVGEGGWDRDAILAATPPSKPMLYRPVEIYNCNSTYGYPRITWDNNREPDMENTGGMSPFKKYKIYRAGEYISGNLPPLSYTYIDTYDDYTPDDTANYIDYHVALYCGFGSSTETYNYRYKIVAVDSYTDESVMSDFVSTAGHSSMPDSPPVITEEPITFGLGQNYPNPFNPTTEIKYSIPNSSFVTLKVYNAIGQMVAELVNNEYKTKGRYSVNFDASNLASGIYFYSLEAGTFKDTKKMVLIK